MIASSFPKYPGEMTAPFIEEIAAAVTGQKPVDQALADAERRVNALLEQLR